MVMTAAAAAEALKTRARKREVIVILAAVHFTRSRTLLRVLYEAKEHATTYTSGHLEGIVCSSVGD